MTALASDLLLQQASIDGRWVDADDGATFDGAESRRPASRSPPCPRMGAAETRRAIEAADAALPAWRAELAAERARILRRWADLMLEPRRSSRSLLTAEQGKPLAESRGEIAYARAFLEWFGEEAQARLRRHDPRPTRPTAGSSSSSSRSA